MHLSYRGRRNVRIVEREEFYKNLRDMVILQNKYNNLQYPVHTSMLALISDQNSYTCR